MGIVLAFAWLGHAVGGFQGAVLFDMTGSYVSGFVIAAAVGTINLVLVSLLLLLSRPRRTLAQA